MFDTMRKNIGITATRIFVRKKNKSPVQFSRAYSNARTALVILPENEHHYAVALPVLTLLRNKFYGNRMTIVSNEAVHKVDKAFSSSTIVSVNNTQMNMFFLPKRAVVQRLLAQQFDVLVDLNFSLVPIAAYLCRTANAYLKVGFVQHHADAYYNFQINAMPDRQPKLRYEQLFRTLSMF
jgi:hypothetical protein